MSAEEHEQSKPIPAGQKWFDNLTTIIVWSLLFTTLMYNVWALIDLMNIPPLP